MLQMPSPARRPTKYLALVAVGLGGLVLALGLGADQPIVEVLAMSLLAAALFAAFLAVIRVERWVEPRWLRSAGQYRRVWWGVLAILALGWLIWGVYRTVQGHGDPLGDIGTPVFWLFWGACAAVGEGPARTRSLRQRTGSARRHFTDRHPNYWLYPFGTWPVGAALGLLIDKDLGKVVLGVALAELVGILLYMIISQRRERQALGFDPDFYLAVERQVSEHDHRPELLFHQTSKQPEYSGWYAYASEQDAGSPDLVAWSLRDLIDQTPEAARPLREGHGIWKWDHATRAYSPAAE